MTRPYADAAVAYAERGWRVFRIAPGSKVPLDKWAHGDNYERATADPDEVRRRMATNERYGECNIGIATGQGLAVLDVDVHHGGAVPDWAPPTLTARTPNGGVHLYYSVEREVRNSAGQLGQGLDVRGDGGIVVAPPSVIYENGLDAYHGKATYAWVNDLPLYRLEARILTPQQPSNPGARGVRREVFGPGEQHHAMVSLAGKMRSFGCEYPEIKAALWALNQTRFQPVLDDEWVTKVARSIVEYAPDSGLLG